MDSVGVQKARTATTAEIDRPAVMKRRIHRIVESVLVIETPSSRWKNRTIESLPKATLRMLGLGARVRYFNALTRSSGDWIS